MNPPITRAEVSCIVNEELRDTISAVHHLERAIAERNVDYRDRFDRIDKACEILTTSVASMQTTVAGMQASLQLLTSERMGLRRFAAGVLQVLLTAAICYAALHFVKG